MRRHVFASLMERLYGRLPMKRAVLTMIARLEGGQLYSVSLRKLLQRRFGVEVGAYSYGSLLEPGMADRGTKIGPYVSVGPNVRRFGAAHPLDDLSMHPFWYNPRLGVVAEASDVTRTGCEIGAESWIGANVTILPSCRRIGVGAVIGAGTVVTKDIGDFAVVVGNPGREIGIRLTPQLRNKLLERRPWTLQPSEARAAYQDLLASTKSE
jgi:acetyltransferase-like isoleucine patch superfamily enzyme